MIKPEESAAQRESVLSYWIMSTDLATPKAETPLDLKRCTRKLDDGSQCANPRADQDEKATNRHCLECRRDAQRKYVTSTLQQQAGKGFVKGIEEMRTLLVREFRAQGQASFTGIEISELIRLAPGPVQEIKEAIASVSRAGMNFPEDGVAS
jgi:hypothetical protein